MAFMVAVTDKTGKKLPFKGVYDLEIKMMHYFLDTKNMQPGFNSTIIEYEPCNLEKHNETYSEILNKTPYNTMFCLALGQQNKTLYGKLGDFQNGFSLLGVYINRCNPKQQKCLNDSMIEHYLSDFVLGITYSSYTVDHFNYLTPNSPKLENNGVFPMSLSLLKCYFYNLAQIIYETDYGIIFEKKQVLDFYKFESQTVDVNMPGTSNSIFSSEFTVGYILFKCSDNISLFNRSYGKAQAVIANIGGLINAILVVAKIIFDFFTRKFIMVDLANMFFGFSDQYEIRSKKYFHKKNIIVDQNICNDNNISNNKSKIFCRSLFENVQINNLINKKAEKDL